LHNHAPLSMQSQWLIGVVFCGLACTDIVFSAPDVPPDVLFARQCSGCHTIGRGDLIGPDLKGVTTRHGRAWLLRFIRSSRDVIESGDPTAAALFERYKRQRMPDHDFAPATVDALLDYVTMVKPEETDGRSAEDATDAIIRRGFELFVGRVALTTKAPCSACHSIRHPLVDWTTTMATFGPELSEVYDKYYDKPLAASLRAPCWPRTPDESVRHALTADESLALRAFMRDASRYAAANFEERRLQRRQLPR